MRQTRRFGEALTYIDNLFSAASNAEHDRHLRTRGDAQRARVGDNTPQLHGLDGAVSLIHAIHFSTTHPAPPPTS